MSEIKIKNMESLAAYRSFLCRHPKLIYLFLELTDQCNLSCIHCGSSCSARSHSRLSFESVSKLLDSISQKYPPRSVMLCVTGGEPLMNHEFFDIVTYANRLGFPWGMTTNGTLIDQRTARDLVHAGMGTVTISIDGLREKHDQFRNTQGAFEKAVRGIQNLLHNPDQHIPVQITTVIHKQNLSDLEAIYEFLLGLGVEFWRLVSLEPIGRALSHPELPLDGSDYKRLFRFIREKRYSPKVKMDVTYGCSHYLTVEYEREVRDNYFICGSGIYVASILCNGDIYSCLDIERRPELVQGNITTDDFITVWETGFEAFREDRTPLSEKCSNCEDKAFCLADSTHTWDFDRHRPKICLKTMLNET